MQVQYFEIVTEDVDAVCATYSQLYGVTFSDGDAGLGDARTAPISGGGMLGVRAPLHETEEPVVRPYLLVDDIESAIAIAVERGGEIAHPPLELPGHGTFAIFVQGGIHHGLWQKAPEEGMSAKGAFEIDMAPQADPSAPAGRMVLRKTYHGDMSGSGLGQMISKRTESGAAVYFAIEEFSGSVEGRSGAFTLVHQGRMTKDTRSLEVNILEGSGSGELMTITGSMLITQDEDGHGYELRYEL